MSNDIYDPYPPIQNKYYKWYMNICQKNQYRIKEKGLIRHHIDPKSFYTKYAKNGWKITDPDVMENIVFLTNKEHFLCHKLLTKCYEQLAKQKMCQAFHRMCNGNKTSIYYAYSRKMFRENIQGESHPMFGKIGPMTGTIRTSKQIEAASIANSGSKNPNAKRTEQDINFIRQLYKIGFKQNLLGAMFEMTTGQMNAVVHGRAWKSI